MTVFILISFGIQWYPSTLSGQQGEIAYEKNDACLYCITNLKVGDELVHLVEDSKFVDGIFRLSMGDDGVVEQER